MLLTLNEVTQLKQAMSAQGIAVHFHNTCGSQYFTLDEASDAAKAAIERYFRDRPQNKLVFQPDGLGFYIMDK